MLDRRIAPRAPVDLLLNQYVDGYPYLARAVNISFTGALLQHSSRLVPRSTLCAVELDLDDGKGPVWVWARPAWSSGDLEAVRFLAMDADDEARLTRALEARGGAFTTDD